MPEAIRVDGLKQLVKQIKAIDATVPKAIRVAGNEAAAEVVKDAQSRVPLGPGKGGHAKSSVKAASTQTAVRVKEGGSRYPYMPWLDFGGRVGRNRSVSRPFQRTGRYIWRAYADHKGEIADKYEDALKGVLVDNGWDVR